MNISNININQFMISVAISLWKSMSLVRIDGESVVKQALIKYCSVDLYFVDKHKSLISTNGYSRGKRDGGNLNLPFPDGRAVS